MGYRVVNRQAGSVLCPHLYSEQASSFFVAAKGFANVDLSQLFSANIDGQGKQTCFHYGRSERAAFAATSSAVVDRPISAFS